MTVIGRNDPCPCGSGKKYKKCCLTENKVVSTEEFHYQRLSEAYNRGFDKMDEISPFRHQEAWTSAQELERQGQSSQESLIQNPEIQQYLAETMRSHWEGWVDMKIPALGQRTPREAVRTADGREAVEALLIDFERGKAIQPELNELNQRGVQRVRELLGLPKKV
jgi:hypothetical protein